MSVEIETNGDVWTVIMPVREALRFEWAHGFRAIEQDGIASAGRFRNGAGRHGDFSKI